MEKRIGRRITRRSSGKFSSLILRSILSQSARKKPKLIINENDRISILPEFILHYILSFLDIIQVVQTSILSNTWRTLWKTPISVNFDNNTFCSIIQRNSCKTKTPEQLIDDMIRVWKSLQSVRLHVLRLSISEVDEVCTRKLFGVLENSNVHNLDLSLYVSWPLRLCSFKCLSTLKLNLNWKQFMSWCLPESMTLRTLHLESVFLISDVFAEIFSAFPLLSNLIITNCAFHGKVHITISSPLLQHMEINKIYTHEAQCMTVCAPDLISFTCRAAISNKYSFENLSSIEIVDIEMKLPHSSKKGVELTMQQKKEFGIEMVKLLGGLCNAKSVRVSGLILEVIMQETGVLLTPFGRLRHLHMTTWLSRNSIKAIHCLLYNSDKLESLFVEIIKAEVALTIEGAKYLCDCKFLHLRHFKIKNIQGFKEELEFLKGMLKSAINLEELIIVRHKDPVPGSEKGLEDMRETLLTFPEASTRMKIHLI